MLFHSYPFLFAFLPAVVAICAGVARAWGGRAACAWIVLASLFFYGWWNPPLTGMLLGSIAFNYALGVLLGAAAPGGGRRRRAILALGIAANLGLLADFKYANFAIELVNALSGAALEPVATILPLAISFFTFQQIAYLVDAFRGQAPRYSFLHYSSLVCFFPHLIAGPIVQHRELLPQLARPDFGRIRARQLAEGITLLLIGLFKKGVVADGIAGYADAVFAAAAGPAPLALPDAWGGALAFSFQLYFDFSGYTDMALGLAWIFGVRLPENFDSPYKARSPIEFWRRWHITLSRFLRDYLYVPLGGNRRGAARRHVNLLATMLLGGLWHGAGWTFVVWGGLHGALLVLNHAWRGARGRLGWGGGGGPIAAAVSTAATFLCVVAAWVFFRAESLPDALAVLRAMSGLEGCGPPVLTRPGPLASPVALFALPELALLALLLLFVWGLPNTQQLFAAARGTRSVPRPWLDLSWRPTRGWAAFAGLLGGAALLGLSQGREFVYFQF